MIKPKRRVEMMIILLIVLVGLAIVLHLPEQIWKRIYPISYQESVNLYATENQLDPLLVYAIIKAESNFKVEAVSKSGAKGLMQLMDSTAAETAKKVGIEYESEMLFDANINIRLGTKYFAGLLQKYGNLTVALTAYNAGSGNVDKWIENGTLQKDGSDAENIPYRETNHYVRKILSDYEMYLKVYQK